MRNVRTLGRIYYSAARTTARSRENTLRVHARRRAASPADTPAVLSVTTCSRKRDDRWTTSWASRAPTRARFMSSLFILFATLGVGRRLASTA